MKTTRAVAVGGAVLVLTAGVFIGSTFTSSAQLLLQPDILLPSPTSDRPDSVVREPPKTAFRGWVDGLGSRFGVIGFMATSLVCVFPTFASVFLLGCLLFLGLNCAFQAARNGNNFNRTICS